METAKARIRQDRPALGEIELAVCGRVPEGGPIHCANCIHCKLVPASIDLEGHYRLRVRCDAGKWRKRCGEEKIYKYFTVARRSIPSCDSYEDMGESAEFLKDLREILPTTDEIY